MELYRPGVPLPGQEVQTVKTYTGALASAAVALPIDDTIPQNTEGGLMMTQAIVPTSSANVLRIGGLLALSDGAGGTSNTGVALFQDSIANALAVQGNTSVTPGAAWFQGIIEWSMLAATLSSTTFKVRVGDAAGSTISLNGLSAARKFGGAMASVLRVREIMA
jgi:hypothetical protein